MKKEGKSFLVTRAASRDRGSFDKLQEVGLLLLWLFSNLRIVWWLSCLRGMSGCILNHGKLPHSGSAHYPDLRADFWVRSEGNFVVSLSRKF